MKKTPHPTIRYVTLILAGSTALAVIGCSPENEEPGIKTLETEQTQNRIENYADQATDASKKNVEVAFAALDQEIKELETRVAATTGPAKAEAEYKLEELKKRRSDLRSDFNEAKFNTLIQDIKNSVR